MKNQFFNLAVKKETKKEKKKVIARHFSNPMFNIAIQKSSKNKIVKKYPSPSVHQKNVPQLKNIFLGNKDNRIRFVKPFGDHDRDGFINALDCKPFDRKRQDITSALNNLKIGISNLMSSNSNPAIRSNVIPAPAVPSSKPIGSLNSVTSSVTSTLNNLKTGISNLGAGIKSTINTASNLKMQVPDYSRAKIDEMVAKNIDKADVVKQGDPRYQLMKETVFKDNPDFGGVTVFKQGIGNTNNITFSPDSTKRWGLGNISKESAQKLADSKTTIYRNDKPTIYINYPSNLYQYLTGPTTPGVLPHELTHAMGYEKEAAPMAIYDAYKKGALAPLLPVEEKKLYMDVMKTAGVNPYKTINPITSPVQTVIYGIGKLTKTEPY